MSSDRLLDDDDESFQPHYDTRIDSASKRNKYQEYILVGKSDGLDIWDKAAFIPRGGFIRSPVNILQRRHTLLVIQ
jgi:hypothetical protein